jgi:hypothetical protein
MDSGALTILPGRRLTSDLQASAAVGGMVQLFLADMGDR